MKKWWQVPGHSLLYPCSSLLHGSCIFLSRYVFVSPSVVSVVLYVSKNDTTEVSGSSASLSVCVIVLNALPWTQHTLSNSHPFTLTICRRPAWASLHSLSTSCGCHLVSNKSHLKVCPNFSYTKGQSWDTAQPRLHFVKTTNYSPKCVPLPSVWTDFGLCYNFSLFPHFKRQSNI